MMSLSLKNTFRAAQRLLQDALLLASRLLLGQVFLSSGLSKWDGWFDFNESKLPLFKYEFFCPDPPRSGALQLCDAKTLSYPAESWGLWLAEALAYTAAVAEVVLPALLFVGLLSRPAALGLLGMTLFIQLFVYPEWGHFINPAAWWLLVASLLLVYGPGRLSVDHIIQRYWFKKATQ